MNVSILMSFLISVACFSQKISVDPEFKTNETRIITKIDNNQYILESSYDIKKDNTIEVNLFKYEGFKTTGVRLVFSGNNITPKVFLWADYPAFNEKNSIEYDLKFYSLTLNKIDLKEKDTLMGKLELLSLPIKHYKNSPELYFRGEFMHIIGKSIIVRNGEKSIRQE